MQAAGWPRSIAVAIERTLYTFRLKPPGFSPVSFAFASAHPLYQPLTNIRNLLRRYLVLHRVGLPTHVVTELP